MTDKLILDACCGSRMFWFDKQNPNVLFADIRNESHTLCDGRHLEIKPDMEMDFTNMSFADGTFSLVVFDPPQLIKLGKNSWMAKKYGVLSATWQNDITKGFNECMRVLKTNGILIFKWNERDIKVSELLSVIKTQPLFGHTTRKNSETIWMCLAVVDPPYGIGESKGKNNSRGSYRVAKYIGTKKTTGACIPSTYFETKDWDNSVPSEQYFLELRRISVNQIIWGVNYFNLPATPCYLVWDKDNGTTDFADCELAWTSFDTAVRKFKYTWNGMLQYYFKLKKR